MDNVWLKNNVEYCVNNETFNTALDTLNSLRESTNFLQASDNIIEMARSKIADLVFAKDKEIIFTSGSVESNNLAIEGVTQSMEGKGDIFFVGSLDSLSAKKTARKVRKKGFKMAEIPATREGYYDLEKLTDQVNLNTIFSTFSSVQYETGARQNVNAITSIFKKVSAIVHVDLSFGLTELPNMQKNAVDLATIGGKEIGAGFGSGVLYVREGVLVNSIYSGNIRKNKFQIEENVLSALMMQTRLVEINNKKAEEKKRLAKLKTQMFADMKKEEIEFMNNSPEDSHPGTIALSFRGFDAESLTERLKVKGYEVFTHVKTIEDDEKVASLALIAMGAEFEDTISAITIGFCEQTSAEEVTGFVKALKDTLDEMS